MEDESKDYLKELGARVAKAPVIEKPDDGPIADGSVCWLDQNRICGPECIAFNHDSLGVETEGVRQGSNQCVILAVMAQQGSAALVTIRKSRLEIQAQEDRIRESRGAAPVPKVK